jgi:hypothetical protein
MINEKVANESNVFGADLLKSHTQIPVVLNLGRSIKIQLIGRASCA